MRESNQLVQHPWRPRGSYIDHFIKCSGKGFIYRKPVIKNTRSVSSSYLSYYDQLARVDLLKNNTFFDLVIVMAVGLRNLPVTVSQ